MLLPFRATYENLKFLILWFSFLFTKSKNPSEVASRIKELREDMKTFSSISDMDFTSFCNDIFADGWEDEKDECKSNIR